MAVTFLRKRVALLDVPLDVDETQCRRSTVAFTPHVFIQIGWHHTRRCPDHLLKSSLHSTPVCFDVVGAYTRNWIGEVLTMVHRLVNIAKTRQLGVCTPLVGPHRCPGSDDALDDRKQRAGVTALHHLNEALTQRRVINTIF